MKELSIIVPMYNSQAYINKCLASFLVSEDMMRSLEVIIVNDGSTDKSTEQVIPYVEQCPDVYRLLEKKNGGHGSAVNMGIAACTGRFFKVVDADDWVDTEALEHVLEKLESIDAEVVVTGYRTFNIKSNVQKEMSVMYRESMYCMEKILELWKDVRENFCIHGIIYNTSFYNAIKCRLPEKVYYDDAFYYTVPCSYAEQIYLLKDIVTVYRIGDTEQSVSKKSRIARVAQHEKVIYEIVRREDSEYLSEAGKRYWLLKSRTTICDYFTTVFLRYDNRREGLEKGRAMYHFLKKQNKELYLSLRKRYWIYRFMRLLHMDEKCFMGIVNSDIYKALVNGK